MDETGDPFRVLIAVILSLRTQDTTTRPGGGARLFALADTPAAMLRLTPGRSSARSTRSGSTAPKRASSAASAATLLGRFDGRVPDDLDAPSPSTASAEDGEPRGHHRVRQAGNRVDDSTFIASRIASGTSVPATPEETRWRCGRSCPGAYWIGYNDLLVSFRPERLRADLAPLLGLPGRRRSAGGSA